MKTNQMANNHPTTTEELIVQYLDGELARKELETVLFDRLAHSEEARMLLREYLVVRGAIRMSHEDERFQLSDDLDHRTRTRIQQMMEAIDADATPIGEFAGDKAAVRSSATSRRMKVWQRRSIYTALGLLLLMGAWFLGESNRVQAPSHSQIAQAPEVQTPSADNSTAPQTGVSATHPEAPRSQVFEAKVPEKLYAASMKKEVSKAPASEAPMASEPSHAVPAAQNADADQDVMLSQRFAKAINSAKNNEVVVSSRDRL